MSESENMVPDDAKKQELWSEKKTRLDSALKNAGSYDEQKAIIEDAMVNSKSYGEESTLWHLRNEIYARERYDEKKDLWAEVQKKNLEKTSESLKKFWDPNREDYITKEGIIIDKPEVPDVPHERLHIVCDLWSDEKERQRILKERQRTLPGTGMRRWEDATGHIKYGFDGIDVRYKTVSMHFSGNEYTPDDVLKMLYYAVDPDHRKKPDGMKSTQYKLGNQIGQIYN